MTRSGVGRSLRTASRQAYAPPAGDRAFPPPHSQSAAGTKRTVRIGRSVLRAGLRTLVVVGFAGVAWLLGANAAQATDAPATDRTIGLPTVDLVPLPGANESLSGGTASTTLASPLTEAVTAAYQPARGSVAALLTDTEALGTAAASVVLPGDTADRAAPIVDPALIVGPDAVSIGGVADRLADWPDAAAGDGAPVRSPAPSTVMPTVMRRVAMAAAGESAGPRQRQVPTDRREAGASTVNMRIAVRQGGDLPVPATPAPSGGRDGWGTLASGSGVWPEGGCCGAVPVSAASIAGAVRRLPAVVTVEVPRPETGTPAVSPD